MFIMESDLDSNPVMSARQSSQNFLNEKAEAKLQRHVPQGHSWMPRPARPSESEDRRGRKGHGFFKP